MKTADVLIAIVTGIHQPALFAVTRYFLIAARDLSNIIMN
jgi:hypothetical protein